MATMAKPAALLGNHSPAAGMTISIFSESEGVSGRQQLLARGESRNGGRGWSLLTQQASPVFRFPGYSVRLNISGTTYWRDVRKGMLLTGLILGLGITLLLVELTRLREQRARVLQDRNREIEMHVAAQTRELEEARDQAVAAARAKADFLSSMSHEIRTPLNAIIGMAELLAESRLEGEQRHYVDVFHRAGNRLLLLVNDILDLSRIESGQLELERLAFAPEDVLHEAAEIHALQAEEKGIELVVCVAPGVPATLYGDPVRLRQVVLNLIGNAIKFTDRGEIVVRADRAPQDAQSIIISVADTGIGISNDKLETIFASFTQGDSSITRRYGGSGLGLSISDRLVRLMGGVIRVESRPGHGSAFSVHLPLVGEPATEESGGRRLPQGLRVLVACAHPLAGGCLCEPLAPFGGECRVTNTWQDAMQALQSAAAAGKPWQVLLLEADFVPAGQEAAAQDYLADHGRPALIGLLQTGRMETGLELLRGLGADKWLVKPVRRDSLFDAVREVLQAGAAEPAAVGRHREFVLPAAGILLVEDTEDNRTLVRAFLKSYPLVIDEAHDGREGLEKFKKGAYALVLMDVQMPVMDGYSATRAMREWEREQGREPVPVIALTAHAEPENRALSLAAGCSGHLTKPIKKETLLETLRQFLGP